MANAFEIKITGLQKVNQALYSYSQKLGDKVVIDSLRLGARLVQRAARAAAPKKTGRLRRGIVVKKSRIFNGKFNTDKIGVYLTIKSGRKFGEGDAYYGRFQEDGWETKGATRTEENTPGRRNRRGKLLLSRAATGGRTTMPGRQSVLGKNFIKGAFFKNRENAVRLIIQAATSGAEILARKTGLK